MLEQTDRELIDDILSSTNDILLKKSNLKKLQQIKNKATNGKDKECFCASVRRKVWLKDFRQWYEGVTG